jgi:hypothetical protein
MLDAVLAWLDLKGDDPSTKNSGKVVPAIQYSVFEWKLSFTYPSV